MVEGTPELAGRASGRAKGELERARDIRFGAGQSLLVGMFIGWAGVALKLGFLGLKFEDPVLPVCIEQAGIDTAAQRYTASSAAVIKAMTGRSRTIRRS